MPEPRFPSPADGPLASNSFSHAAAWGATEMRRHGAPARERVRVMKLAWNAIATEFGGHQGLYEQFPAVDPVLGRQIFYQAPRTCLAQALAERVLAESTPSS